MPDISFHNVSKNFADTKALSNLSFVCHEGEVHTLLGENGAGKSTLAGLLAGLYLPSSGEIRIANEIVRLASPQKSLQCGIGVVFQHPLLVPELTVIENILLCNSWWKLCTTKKYLPRYYELSSLLGIDIDPSQRVKHLSLAQQQYIEIMRALWHRQHMLVFDEATALLSVEEAKRLGEIIQKLAKNKHTILYITHKLHEAIAVSHAITIVRQGQKTAEITYKTLEKAKCCHNIQQLEQNICRALFGDEDQAPLAPLPFLLKKQSDQGQCNAKNSNRNPNKDNKDKPLLELTLVSSHEEEQACSIKNISLSIKRNQILGISGIDGHGQKHFAEVLAGQRLAQSGSIFLHGHEITGLSNRERQKLGIHYATEDRLLEGLVGSEDIALNLQTKNIGLKPFWKYGIAKWKQIQNHAKTIMKAFSIPYEYRTNAARNLSGGTMQKIILARELNQPNLCVGILHQPTHGLDIKTAKILHDLLRDKARQNCSFIIISSDIDELLSLSTHLAVLKNGTLSASFENSNKARQTLTSLIATT